MINFLAEKTSISLSPKILTVIWARRFTSYKRPDLLFSNLDELSKMTNLFPAVQFIVAGQTDPSDAEAGELALRLKGNLEEKKLGTRVILLTSYNLTIAKKLTAGADVWLNTPIPGTEASGTSGMKSGINGALQFSTNDGWTEEVNWDSFGWVLPEENITKQLYSILESKIIPLYYKVDQNSLPVEWISRMRKTISLIEENFTTRRLLQDYMDKLYLI